MIYSIDIPMLKRWESNIPFLPNTWVGM